MMFVPKKKGTPMDQDQDTPNAALIALIAISHYILSENALDDDFGRGQVKEIFRSALAAVPSVQDTPEWGVAAFDRAFLRMSNIEPLDGDQANDTTVTTPVNKE